MAKIRAIGLTFVCSAALFYALKSMLVGSINMGGKYRESIVRFSEEPGLFLIGVGFLIVLGIGGIIAAVKMWNAADED